MINKQEFCDAVINKFCGACELKNTCAAYDEYNLSFVSDNDILPCLVCDLLDLPIGAKFSELKQN